jgi:hypothetical protein
VSHKRKPEHAIKLNVIQPKSVLNRSGMGGFTLNPYVRCEADSRGLGERINLVEPATVEDALPLLPF